MDIDYDSFVIRDELSNAKMTIIQTEDASPWMARRVWKARRRKWGDAETKVQTSIDSDWFTFDDAKEMPNDLSIPFEVHPWIDAKAIIREREADKQEELTRSDESMWPAPGEQAVEAPKEDPFERALRRVNENGKINEFTVRSNANSLSTGDLVQMAYDKGLSAVSRDEATSAITKHWQRVFDAEAGLSVAEEEPPEEFFEEEPITEEEDPSEIQISSMNEAISLLENEPKALAKIIGMATNVLDAGDGEPVPDEADNEHLRYVRGANKIKVTDLANAGKRGKNAELFVMSLPGEHSNEVFAPLFKAFVATLKLSTYGEAKSNAKKIIEALKFYDDTPIKGAYQTIYTDEVKGVHVSPAGMKYIDIQGAHGLRIEADMRSFVITNTARNYRLLPDRSATPRSIKKFWTWAGKNKKKLKTISSDNLGEAMRKLGVPTHQIIIDIDGA